MVIFVEGLHVNILISTFCVSADVLQGLPKALQHALHTLLFISLKFVTNSEMLTETLHRIPFSLIGSCSSVSVSASYWLHGKCVKFICHKRLSVLLYRITGGFFRYAFSGPQSPL
jgi:hypothetical protein